MHELTGYSFPNDIHILWSLMIVMYPFMTGLVAGAFVIASLYHVFQRDELKPVARLAVAASLAFVLFAPLTLGNHLGQPLRGLNVMLTPNFSSAMAAFGFVFGGYALLVLLEVWLLYRKYIVLSARRSRGLKRWFYAVLALGVYDISDTSRRIDHRLAVILTGIGIPAACLLHGYVGFIFGAVKANPWWSSPIMPIAFLFSAMVSGTAMLVILYQTAMKFRGERISGPCVQSLARWLWLFAIVAVSLEMLDILALAYEGDESWHVIGPLLSGRLAFSFIGIQCILGALVPFILLGVVVLMNKYLTDPIRNTLTLVASLLLLLQVFAMRWNVVIGGQMISKSFRGYRLSYTPEFFEKEGILAAICIFIGPLVFLVLFNKFFPLFDPIEEVEHSVEHEQNTVRESTGMTA